MVLIIYTNVLYKRKRGKRYMKKVEKEKQKDNFTKLTHKRGISLIVLIVTIIVIIILAAVVILTITKNNPVESVRKRLLLKRM